MHLCCMRSKVYLMILSYLVLLISCKRAQTTSGIIFERKHMEHKKLQIKYRYQVADARYTDSVTINNQVIKSDTVSVSFERENPSKSFVDLIK